MFDNGISAVTWRRPGSQNEKDPIPWFSRPYDSSKTIVASVKEMAKKLEGLEKTLSEGSHMLVMGFHPPRAFPRSIPFGNGSLGLIGWYPWPILAPGVLQSWENLFVPHHAAPLSFPRAIPAIKSCSGGCPFVGINFFFPITQLPWPPRNPSPSIIFGRMLISRKCFPRLFPLLGTHPGHLRPLPYVSPVCMHLFMADIFYL